MQIKNLAKTTISIGALGILNLSSARAAVPRVRSPHLPSHSHSMIINSKEFTQRLNNPIHIACTRNYQSQYENLDKAVEAANKHFEQHGYSETGSVTSLYGKVVQGPTRDFEKFLKGINFNNPNSTTVDTSSAEHISRNLNSDAAYDFRQEYKIFTKPNSDKFYILRKAEQVPTNSGDSRAINQESLTVDIYIQL
ncbi:MAG: hypothetical protein QNJ31_03970 [Candidatus Caenarcaniphilales bacterium]|nr:hypothetical protein [Candidatus Caenarcaniphilales bacterium]